MNRSTIFILAVSAIMGSILIFSQYLPLQTTISSFKLQPPEFILETQFSSSSGVSTEIPTTQTTQLPRKNKTIPPEFISETQSSSSNGISTEIPTTQTTQLPLKNKTILYWNSMGTHSDWCMGFGSKIFENCTYNNCFTTNNRSLLPMDQFDAIFFHGFQYNDASGKPEKRDPRQMYVFGNLESPTRTPTYYMKNHNYFYNWTMTYRRDSDVVRPYGYIDKRTTAYNPPSVEDIQKRPKKVVWFVSNCQAPNHRDRLYDEMKKYLEIDAYGKCYDLQCSRKNESLCYNMMEQDYKFYLAFENSICEEYVTEKLYNVLQKDIVPIVFGGADYSIFAPPKSVINVMDFKSVKELVEYVKFLDEHPVEYLKYFDWKKDSVAVTDKRFVCELCRKLNEPITPKTYPNIREWWKRQGSCSYEFLDKFLKGADKN